MCILLLPIRVRWMSSPLIPWGATTLSGPTCTDGSCWAKAASMNCNGRTALSKYHGWITVVMRNHPEAGVRFRNQPGVTDPGQPGSPEVPT